MKPLADKLQRSADGWTIAAGIIGVITGLTVWGTWTAGTGQSGPTTAAVVTSAIAAVAAGVLALIPRVKQWTERAAAVRSLAAQYGEMYGRLEDLVQYYKSTTPPPQDFDVKATVLMADYQALKKEKDLVPGVSKRTPNDKQRTGA